MIVELRQYTLHPGRRDDLITLFDAEFVDTQEAEGMTVVGQFRDLDDPDRFVWLRAFADMESRAGALSRFYGGPAWRAHSAEANATMIDSDDVLLLRSPGPLPATGGEEDDGLILATLYFRDHPFDDAFAELVTAQAARAGVAPLALLRTEYAENNFPALPVRTGEHVLVWLARFRDEAEAGEHLRTFPRLTGSPQHLRLAPAGRSRLR
jgi:quinol monooxygenase YgiN